MKTELLEYIQIVRARPTEVTPHTEAVIGWSEPQSFFHWFDGMVFCAGILKFGPRDAHS